MVTLSDPYRTWASQGGEDQGGPTLSTRAQSCRSVEVERPFPAHLCVPLESLVSTLSDPYRTLASQGGEDQRGPTLSTRAQSGRSVKVERPFVRVYGVSCKGLRAI